MPAEIIFKSRNILVVYNNIYSDNNIWITFNELGFKPDANRFWGDRFLEKNAISGIGIVTTYPNWYPPDDMQIAIQEIRGLYRNRTVVCYGHSQGGYGAIKYSRALSASIVLAFSPQFSINPSVVAKNDNRFTNYYVGSLCNGQPVTSNDVAGRVYVFYDNGSESDKWNVQKLKEITGDSLYEVVCPFTDHNSVQLISESKLGNELIRIAHSESDEKKQALRSLVRIARKSSPTYYTYLFRYLLDKKQRLDKLQTLFDRLPGYLQKEFNIQRHISDGALALAEALLADLTIPELQMLGIVRFMQIARRHGFLTAELRIARAILAERSPDVIARLEAIGTLVKCAQCDAAITELREIVLQYGRSIHGGFIRKLEEELNIYVS